MSNGESDVIAPARGERDSIIMNHQLTEIFTAQTNHQLKEIFTLALKNLAGSHEEAITLMTEMFRVASAVELQAAELQTENARLRAALDLQPNVEQNSDLRAALVLHRPPRSSETTRIALAQPPGEPPTLMDISTHTSSSSPLRLPGMMEEQGYDISPTAGLRRTFSSQEASVYPSTYRISESDSCPVNGHLSLPAPRKHDSYISASQSLQIVPITSPCCTKCRMPFLPDATFCHKCGLKCPPRSSVETTISSIRADDKGAEPFQLLPTWSQKQSDSLRYAQHSVARDLVLQDPQMGASFPLDGRNLFKAKTFAAKTLMRLNLYNEESTVPSFCATGVIHPSNFMRGSWDLSSLVLVTYDIVMIPLDSFFEPPESSFTVISSWIVRLFWTFDICLSFLTGYYERDGTIILNRWKIIRRYVYSWFALDCLVVSVDWIELIARSMTSEVGYARIGKVGRSFRIIRMIRLLRLVRMREIVDLICERINSEKLLLLAHITKLMSVILMVAHIVACVWYGIGNTGDPNTWVRSYEFSERPWGDRYAMSLHWSVSQFMGGMDEITPENPGERVFAMLVLMITFIIAALFISSLTSSMTQLELLGSTNSQLLSGLRQYLHQRKISSKLSMRVQRNAQHQMKEQQRNMPEDKIDLLSKVSEPLRIELHFEIYSPAFNCHPFFKRYIKECPQVMRKVCHTAARSVSVSAGDGIFSAGTSPAQPQMYFITDGSLEYMSKGSEFTELAKGEFVSEAVLWVVWMYRGDLTARANSSLIMLDAQQFQDTVNEFHHHSTVAKAYAADFVTRLNRTGDNVSDLHIPSDAELALRARRGTLMTSIWKGDRPPDRAGGDLRELPSTIHEDPN